MENLTFYEVSSLKSAMLMRKMRNECRQFMTRDASKIGWLRQLNWFYTTYRPKQAKGEMAAYIFLCHWPKQDIFNQPVGYGIIRDSKTKPLISGGLLKKYRGKGLGKTLFKILTRIASQGERGEVGRRSVFLEVLETNQVAIDLYKKLGYVEKMRHDGVIDMQHDYGEFDYE